MSVSGLFSPPQNMIYVVACETNHTRKQAASIIEHLFLSVSQPIHISKNLWWQIHVNVLIRLNHSLTRPKGLSEKALSYKQLLNASWPDYNNNNNRHQLNIDTHRTKNIHTNTNGSHIQDKSLLLAFNIHKEECVMH